MKASGYPSRCFAAIALGAMLGAQFVSHWGGTRGGGPQRPRRSAMRSCWGTSRRCWHPGGQTACKRQGPLGRAQEIAKVLQEQQLQAVFSPEAVGRTALGKLIKADVLVVARMAQGKQNGDSVDLIVCETRRGSPGRTAHCLFQGP